MNDRNESSQPPAAQRREWSPYSRLMDDGRYEFGRVVYNRANRRKDRMVPVGTGTWEEAEAFLNAHD
jgi:hypothetical protein